MSFTCDESGRMALLNVATQVIYESYFVTSFYFIVATEVLQMLVKEKVHNVHLNNCFDKLSTWSHNCHKTSIFKLQN